MVNIRNYIEVAKPRTVLLLVFTSFVAMTVASHFSQVDLPVLVWLTALIAITAGCAGCNTVTCYVDRDIDAVMSRTRNRPLPSTRINPPEKALIFGLVLIAVSLALALARNLLSFTFMALGAFDNVVIYSLLLKRKNPVNIILGGVSGGLPVAFGWAYIVNEVGLTMLMMAALVVLWIPNHIWSLALLYREDYERAKVPMLPVVTNEKTALRCIVSTSVLLNVFSILLYFFGAFGIVYLVTAGVLGAITLIFNLKLFIKPNKQNSWTVFKFSSPYLAVIFLAMMIDTLIA